MNNFELLKIAFDRFSRHKDILFDGDELRKCKQWCEQERKDKNVNLASLPILQEINSTMAIYKVWQVRNGMDFSSPIFLRLVLTPSPGDIIYFEFRPSPLLPEPLTQNRKMRNFFTDLLRGKENKETNMNYISILKDTPGDEIFIQMLIFGLQSKFLTIIEDEKKALKNFSEYMKLHFKIKNKKMIENTFIYLTKGFSPCAPSSFALNKYLGRILKRVRKEVTSMENPPFNTINFDEQYMHPKSITIKTLNVKDRDKTQYTIYEADKELRDYFDEKYEDYGFEHKKYGRILHQQIRDGKIKKKYKRGGNLIISKEDYEHYKKEKEEKIIRKFLIDYLIEHKGKLPDSAKKKIDRDLKKGIFIEDIAKKILS